MLSNFKYNHLLDLILLFCGVFNIDSMFIDLIRLGFENCFARHLYQNFYLRNLVLVLPKFAEDIIVVLYFHCLSYPSFYS